MEALQATTGFKLQANVECVQSRQGIRCDGGLKVAKCGKRTSSFSSSTECTVTTLHAEDVGYSTSSTERAGGAGVPGASMRAAGRRRSKRDV